MAPSDKRPCPHPTWLSDVFRLRGDYIQPSISPSPVPPIPRPTVRWVAWQTLLGLWKLPRLIAQWVRAGCP